MIQTDGTVKKWPIYSSDTYTLFWFKRGKAESWFELDPNGSRYSAPTARSFFSHSSAFAVMYCLMHGLSLDRAYLTCRDSVRKTCPDQNDRPKGNHG